ncbi:MAG: hypothetical protein M0T69_12330 [Deltaproteobacteria bacterium]|nr:hypothetical protein [Deltaproteobacteria bacterium]
MTMNFTMVRVPIAIFLFCWFRFRKERVRRERTGSPLSFRLS